jgi:hypothetical protein
MRPLRLLILAAIVLISGAGAASADAWTAVRLRGVVLQLVEGAWQPVHRNDAIADGTVIRTLNSGYVDLTRGSETVSLGPTTQIQIFDKGGAKPFTTVQESFGQVAVEAEVENVQHFAVQTPYLAAVVKGTRFVVTSNNRGASVSVQRGHVEVDDKANKTHTTISVGQTAKTGAATGGKLEVSGAGDLPAVLTADGEPEAVADLQATAAELEAQAKAAEALAKQLGTPEAKAAAEAAKKAADAAKKAADDASKKAGDDAKKAADDAKKAADAAKKAADDAAKKAADAAKKAADDAKKHGPPPPPPKK